MRKYSRTSVVVPLAYACVNTRARPRVLLQLPLTLLALQTHCMQTYLILTDGCQRLGVMEEVGNRQRGYRMDEPPPVSRTHRREPSIAGGTQRHRHQPSEQKVPQTVWDATRYWDVCMTCLLGTPVPHLVRLPPVHFSPYPVSWHLSHYCVSRAPLFSATNISVLGISKPAPSILTMNARRRAGHCPNHMGYFQQQKNEENFGLFEPNKWRSRV